MNIGVVGVVDPKDEVARRNVAIQYDQAAFGVAVAILVDHRIGHNGVGYAIGRLSVELREHHAVGLASQQTEIVVENGTQTAEHILDLRCGQLSRHVGAPGVCCRRCAASHADHVNIMAWSDGVSCILVGTCAIGHAIDYHRLAIDIDSLPFGNCRDSVDVEQRTGCGNRRWSASFQGAHELGWVP